MNVIDTADRWMQDGYRLMAVAAVWHYGPPVTPELLMKMGAALIVASFVAVAANAAFKGWRGGQ